jgi:hypothetical protein
MITLSFVFPTNWLFGSSYNREGIWFTLWAVWPYGILLFLNNTRTGFVKKDVAILITSILVSGFSVYCITFALLSHDAQAGVIFLLMPFFQAFAAAIGGLIGLGLAERSKTLPNKPF